jgi:hypothetical protein
VPVPCPPGWRETLGGYLAKQLPGFGISVREAAKLVGIEGDPTHMQLQQVNTLLTDLGWKPHQLRKAGGGARTKVFLRDP